MGGGVIEKKKKRAGKINEIDPTRVLTRIGFVCLFLRGELGSHGARPRPIRACHASLPSRRGSASHCRPSGSWKMLRYIRNNIRKGVPDCPAVSPIGTCLARGVQRLPTLCPRGEETPKKVYTENS